jgi:hypothetical protein
MVLQDTHISSVMKHSKSNLSIIKVQRHDKTERTIANKTWPHHRFHILAVSRASVQDSSSSRIARAPEPV